MDGGGGQVAEVRVRDEQADQVEPHLATVAGGVRGEGKEWQAVQGKVELGLLRYTGHIDTSHPKEDWTQPDEQTMFQLHNELGNKWAIIGTKLGGKYSPPHSGPTTALKTIFTPSCARPSER